MNYKKHYLALCKSRQGLNRDCKTDSHHIVPVSMGGTNEASNLVDLTYKEHYVAHKLLWKSNPTDRSETMSLIMLFNCVRKWKTTYVHPKFAKDFGDAFSYWYSGVNHPYFGETRHTNVRLASMSAKLTGRTKETHAHVAISAAKQSDKMAGRGNSTYDPTLYHFKNVHTGKVAISDRIGMKEMYGIEVKRLFHVKPQKTCKGWQLMSV